MDRSTGTTTLFKIKLLNEFFNANCQFALDREIIDLCTYLWTLLKNEDFIWYIRMYILQVCT